MIKIGIDFSIISPAFCIEQNDKIEFFAVQRNIKDELKKSFELADVKIYLIDPKIKPEKNITEIERANSKDAHELTTFIMEKLKDYKNISQIAMEGLSFMSRSNIISQFSGYNYVFREKLNQIIPFEKLFVFTPMTVKKIAGKGNFKKEQMIEAFINSNDTSPFHEKLKNEPETFQSKSGKWLKPVDDLVDSYWVLQTLKQLYPENTCKSLSM